jgi:hypothetical protein
MDYSGIAANLTDKTRFYIKRAGNNEQTLNYALKAFSKGLLGESPDELVGSDEKKALYHHAYEDGQTVKQQRELRNKIDQAFERVMQGVKHEQV